MSRVFVVDRRAVFAGDWPQGFTAFGTAEQESFLDRAKAAGRFVARSEAEKTPAWKQWIPYCVVRSLPPAAGTAHPDFGVFVVRRGSRQGESRLHGSFSIGLGGHIEPIDALAAAATGPAFFIAALWRELNEELDLRLSTLPTPRLVGLLNDDSTEVGQVHAGLAYVLDLPLPRRAAEDQVGIREICKMRGGFRHLVDLRRLWQDAACFESWSQFLIRAGIAGPMGETPPRTASSQSTD